MRIVDLTGRQFGTLTALRRFREPTGRGGVTFYECACTCGAKTIVRHCNLATAISCGCHRSRILRTVNIRHGESHSKITAEYRVWRGMRQRCERQANKDFVDYGARGIKVCARWHSYEAFLSDVGRRPSSEHQIERLNNDGDYEPGNVIWANRVRQGRNKRNNRLITLCEDTMTLSAWAEKLNISRGTLWKRLRAMPLSKALQSGDVRHIKQRDDLYGGHHD